MRKYIKKILLWVGTIYACLIIGLLIYQQYFSADARYAQDNLSYVISRTTSTGQYKTNVKLQPMAVNLAVLHKIAMMQTVQYLQEFTIADSYENLPGEPYDIFARLWLRANDPDVQTIYNSIQFMAAFTNPDYPATTAQIITQVQNNQTAIFSDNWGAADQAATNLYNDYKNLLSLHVALLLIIILGRIFSYIKQRKTKTVKIENKPMTAK